MDLDTLLKVAKSKKEETVSVTVRLSVELNSVIEDLAENELNTSKQKTLVALIEEGVKYLEKTLNINEMEEIKEEEKSKKYFHLLNTNKSNDSNDGIRMCTEGIASSFYDPWKFEINKMKKDDIVFLYENGVGIIGYGIADGNVIITDRNGDNNEMYYQNLKKFKKLKTPFPASEIKKVLNGKITFLRTRTSISNGEKLYEKLETIS